MAKVDVSVTGVDVTGIGVGVTELAKLPGESEVVTLAWVVVIGAELVKVLEAGGVEIALVTALFVVEDDPPTGAGVDIVEGESKVLKVQKEKSE